MSSRAARYAGASAAVLALGTAVVPVAHAGARSPRGRVGTSASAAAGTSTIVRTTTTTTTALVTTSSTTAQAPTTPPAVHASAQLFLPDAFMVSHRLVTVPGRSMRVGGVVRPFAPGQRVALRVLVNGRLVKSMTVRLERDRGGGQGHFLVRFSAPRPGRVVVIASHGATPQMEAFKTSRSLSALDEHVGFGSKGRFVELIQERLATLHIYVRRTGVYDQWTGLALDAYHRLLRRGTSQNLDGATIGSLLDGAGRFKIRYPRHGRHAEADLSLQLLALADGSHVQYIFPISSGKPSTPTVLGDYRIYNRVPGYMPDGMYYSSFFYRGYAIHGYDPAPDYPASHGCIRLPIVDGVFVYDWLAMGDWVDVYN